MDRQDNIEASAHGSALRHTTAKRAKELLGLHPVKLSPLHGGRHQLAAVVASMALGLHQSAWAEVNTSQTHDAVPPIQMSLGLIASRTGMQLGYRHFNDRGVVVYDAQQSSTPLSPNQQIPWLQIQTELNPDRPMGLEYLGADGSGTGKLRARVQTGLFSYMVPVAMNTRYQWAELYAWLGQALHLPMDIALVPKVGIKWFRVKNLEASAPKIAAHWNTAGSVMMPTLGLSTSLDVGMIRVSITSEHSTALLKNAKGSTHANTVELSHAWDRDWTWHLGYLHRQTHLNAEQRPTEPDEKILSWQLNGGYIKLTRIF